MSGTNGNGHMAHWLAMSRPPATALKTIKGGRLQGMTDVNPQWRYQAMTEQFGPCGLGWKYKIDKMWTEQGCDGEVLAFTQVSVRVFVHDVWSAPVVGVGGNHLVTKEKAGLRNNDECWKMALTDALSVALKMFGVAADIYAGLWDGSKYVAEPQPAAKAEAPKRIQLTAGTYQILEAKSAQWGGEVVVVDANGEEFFHKTTDKQVLDFCKVNRQDAVPVTLKFEEITRGVNKGKQKLVGVHRWVPPAPPQAPQAPPITADQIPF